MEEKTKEYSTRMQLHIKDFQVKVLEEDQLIKCQLKHIKDFHVKVLEEVQLVKCQLKSIDFQGVGCRSLHLHICRK